MPELQEGKGVAHTTAAYMHDSHLVCAICDLDV